MTHLFLSDRFFHNKGAVAGVFTVVGLVVAVLLVAFITNAVRRRRAQKFDKDVALAAAEAAANARSPDFGVNDDYDYPYGGSGGGSAGEQAATRSMYTGYSDASHGTYAQQPMGYGGAESYGMSEMHGFDPYAGTAAAAGAAGIGAAGLGRSKSTTQPYNAFAGPQGDAYAQPGQTMYDTPAQGQNLRYRQRGTSSTSQDLLDAAGLTPGVGAGAALLSRGPSQSYGQQQQQQQQYQQYQAYPPSLPQSQNASYQTHSSPPPPPAASVSRPTSTVDEDPYDGIDNSHNADGGGLPNPFSPSSQGHGQQKGSRPISGISSSEYGPDEGEEVRDEEDYGYGGRRILKVRGRLSIFMNVNADCRPCVPLQVANE